jgi:hypothetical protein
LTPGITATNVWISGMQFSYQYERYKGVSVTGGGCNWQLSAWVYTPSGAPYPGSTATFYYGYM